MRSVYSYGPLRKCGMAISSEATQANRAPPPMNRGRWTRLPKKLTKTMRTVLPTCRGRQVQKVKILPDCKLVAYTAMAMQQIYNYCTRVVLCTVKTRVRTHTQQQTEDNIIAKEWTAKMRLASKTSRDKNWLRWTQPGGRTSCCWDHIVSQWLRWSSSCSLTPAAEQAAADCDRARRTAKTNTTEELFSFKVASQP